MLLSETPDQLHPILKQQSIHHIFFLHHMRLRNIPPMEHARRRLRRDSTFPEKVLWNALRGGRLCGIRFKRQYSVMHYVLDFYAPSVQLAIEVDGASHNTPEQREYDAMRQREIEQLGITVIRFSNDDVAMRCDAVCDVIEQKIREIQKRNESG